jgi:hypothetical protein
MNGEAQRAVPPNPARAGGCQGMSRVNMVFEKTFLDKEKDWNIWSSQAGGTACAKVHKHEKIWRTVNTDQ